LHAKQTHMSFSISENKVLKRPNLMNCDIWGAYHATRGVWTYLIKEKSEDS